jgi:hypothetical protein
MARANSSLSTTTQASKSLSSSRLSRGVPEIDRARLRPIGRDVSLEGRAGYRPPTVTSAAPLQFLILLVASWIGRRQGEAIEYLRAENRVLRARLGHKRLRFGDGERRLLAQKGKPLGRKLLAEMASLATPETILRWYREQVAAKYDGSRTAAVRAVQPLGVTRSSSC